LIQGKQIIHQQGKIMSDTSIFNKLRAIVAKEMKDESDAAGKVNSSMDTRSRSLARAIAYKRVLDWMDKVEAEEVRSEREKHRTIKDLWVAKNESRGEDDDFNVASLEDRS
jgi:hypothetical protein